MSRLTTGTTLEARQTREAARLAAAHQDHVFQAWDSLTEDEQERLLRQVEAIDWVLIRRLYEELVRDRRPAFLLPSTAWEPAEPLAGTDAQACEVGVAILGRTTHPAYGLIVVAGGSGSGLKIPYPKGVFPATPLSATPLYGALVEKSKAAARAYGHHKMFPIVFLLSEETEAQSRRYLEKHDFFGEPDRILLARQQVLPLLDRRAGSEGRVLMKSAHEIAVGGAGHGDVFDHSLLRDRVTVSWLEKLGVCYVQVLNVDNLLNPVGDPWFLGAHVLSEGAAVGSRAHISLILIPKTLTRRLGNVIQYRQDGQLLHQSVDYGLFPEVDDRCPLGHASLQIVTVPTLRDAKPIPFTVAEKEVKIDNAWVPVWKFERSGNNKERYGALIRRDSEAVFAPIKRPDGDVGNETPRMAARLQSNHWKRLLSRALELRRTASSIPDSTVLELPWDAEHLTPVQLAEALDKIQFPALLRPGTGYLVFPGFRGYREIPLER